VFTQDQRIFVPAATRWCLNLEASVGALNASGEVWFEEL
jgi:hypothetical protein